MKIAAVIAEYNPFHNGHYYQLQKIRKELNVDYIIIIMSGNFVQRGTPALLDKYTRANIALHCGADLIIELPTLFSTSSAELFATGGISILNALGCIDYICFGCENEEFKSFNQIASILHEEPDSYKNLLKTFLKSGISYPKAREEALFKYIIDANLNISMDEHILCSPNNILAIEYLKQLKSSNSKIKPFFIKRMGANYNDKKLHTLFSSASALRNLLESQDDIVQIKRHVPSYCFQQLEAKYNITFPITSNDFSLLLKYKLLLEPNYDYQKYLDISKDFSKKIKKTISSYENFDSFCLTLKSKEITYTRICRCMMHILLNITLEDINLLKKEGYAQYAHILGFRENSLPLLQTIKKKSIIPLFTTNKDIQNYKKSNTDCKEACKTLLNIDLRSSQIYNSVIQTKYNEILPNDFESKFLKVSL